MSRATLLLLSLLCLSGCESPGGNSLAAFGPNTVPPPVRQPGTDPYYTASTAAPAPSATPNLAATTSSDATQKSGGTPGETAAIPSTAAAAEKVGVGAALSASTRPSNEPPIRIIERQGAVPGASSPPSETSRLPSTSGSSPSPLLRSSTTPRLEPIPSSAFGKKTIQSSQVVPASYEQPVGQSTARDTDLQWRRR